MKDVGLSTPGEGKKKKIGSGKRRRDTNLGANIGFPKALHKAGIAAGYRGVARRP